MKKNKSKQGQESLERQIVRGSLFAHSTLGRQSERINEIESFLYGAIDLMMKKGTFREEELAIAVEDVRKETYEKGEQAHAGVSIRIDDENKTQNMVPVNCSERIHICEDICCKLNFALSVEEIETGDVKWDLGQPYFIRHEKNGYCCHLDGKNKHCSIYNSRPNVCKTYSCANDERIWKDFKKMKLNTEWIEKNLQEQMIQLQALNMIQENKPEYLGGALNAPNEGI